jgi:hypothetical protein
MRIWNPKLKLKLGKVHFGEEDMWWCEKGRNNVNESKENEVRSKMCDDTLLLENGRKSEYGSCLLRFSKVKASFCK